MSEGETGDLGREANYQHAREVKRRVQDELLSKANVVGVGIGIRKKDGKPTGETVLVVMVTYKVPRAQLAPEDLIPSQIEGVPVDVQAVGEIESHT